jgi:hypothetical protein
VSKERGQNADIMAAITEPRGGGAAKLRWGIEGGGRPLGGSP